VLVPHVAENARPPEKFSEQFTTVAEREAEISF
jgi:hypothetical protein